MTANEDLIFLELAQKRELLTAEQADEVVALQKKLRGMGLTESVADLVLKREMIPAKDVQLLRMKVSSKGGGQQIEGYRLIERLGRGGMGSVYKADQLSMKRPVALKVLKPALIKDDQQVARLQREAQLVGKLQHPNIVRGLDFGISNGFHYFAMEYVDGRSVKEVVEEDGPFEEAEALRVVREVANALDHAHHEGIVHRDIKPGNILIARDGAVKLADYGLAKGPLEDLELTKSGVTVGTPQYISPEQARGPSEVDIRTDLYSLGATLYHMVTGRTPYQGETLAHLIQQVLYEPYAPPRTLRRDLSQEVCFLIEKLMARKPAHRYQSPAELLADLDAIDAKRTIVPAGWQGDFEAFHLRKRLRRIVVLAILVLVLGGAGAVYFNLRAAEAAREAQAAEGLRAFDALPPVEELSRETLDQVIRDATVVRDQYREYPAGDRAESYLVRLEKERDQLQRVNDLKRETREKLERGEWADVLRALREQRQNIADGEGDLAQRELDEAILTLKARRGRAVKAELEAVKEEYSAATPVAGRDALRFKIQDLERRAFAEDEDRDELVESGKLLNRLDRAIRALDDLLSGPRALLKVEGERDFERIRKQLEDARNGFSARTALRADIDALPAGWADQLRGSFDHLAAELLGENERERDEAIAAADALAEEGKYQLAIDEIADLAARSLEEIQNDLASEERRLTEELRTRKAGIDEEWMRFRRAFAEFLSQREHDAAEVELTSFIPKAQVLVPNPYQNRLDGAFAMLALARSVEDVFLEAVDGRASIPEGFFFSGVTIAPAYDVKRLPGRRFRFARTPGGPAATYDVKSVRVEDLFREVAHARGAENLDTPQIRALRGILLWGELRRVRDIRRERDLLPEILGLIRSGSLGEGESLAPLLEEIYSLVEMSSATVQERIEKLERDAEEKFRKAVEDYDRRNWREAYDGLNLLLDVRIYRETDYIKAREKDIRKMIEDAKTKLPSVRMSEYFKAPVDHVAGESVPSLKYVASLYLDMEKPEEVERFLFDPEWVEIVAIESPRVGPPAPWEAGDPNRTVVEHLLRFDPPEKRSPDPNDLLDRRPLRLESPFHPGRTITVEFRARWNRPRAMVIGVCGTNVVVLSDTTRKEDGRGVHIFQATDLRRPDLFVPDELRGSTLQRNPQLLAGEALRHRYFRFEPDRWYRVRFVKGEKLASLFVDDRLVLDSEIAQYGAVGEEISLITYTPMELDELRITGTVEPKWYSRSVIRGK